jgi:Ni/Co efflux regulator RcnB
LKDLLLVKCGFLENMTNPKKKQKGQKKGKKVPAETEASEPQEETAGRDVDEHPFKNGHYLVVKYRDNSSRIAKVF